MLRVLGKEIDSMKPWLRLALILLSAIAIASITSYAAINLLKLRFGSGGYQRYGPQDQSALTILSGSSLAYDGIDWGRISRLSGGTIESWATPGSSPSEWEVLLRRSPQAIHSIVVVSPYDLNEYWLCDFRADIVPFGDAVRDLRYCGSDGQLCKRIISQYPQLLVRQLLPTVGRSDGLMVGIRASLVKLTGGSAAGDVEEAPKFGSTRPSEVLQKLSDWSPARLQRRLALMRTGFQGKHWFGGPKKMSLERILQFANQHHVDTTILVMPVSPVYRREFLTARTAAEFEEALAELQLRNFNSPLIRIDRLRELDDDGMYSDLVHLNTYGQRLATDALIKQLETRSSGR